jgi:putative membrane protein
LYKKKGHRLLYPVPFSSNNRRSLFHIKYQLVCFCPTFDPIIGKRGTGADLPYPAIPQKHAMAKNYKPLVWTLALGINGLIALSFFLPGKEYFQDYDFSILPLVNAVMNGATFIFLLLALFAIKGKNISRHRNFIFAAFMCTSVFLLSYLLYHFTTPSTKFGGGGVLKYTYYFILITHIILAIVTVPLALISIGRGLNMEVPLHRKIARWTMPVWLYVSATGVIVYLLISPYYNHSL